MAMLNVMCVKSAVLRYFRIALAARHFGGVMCHGGVPLLASFLLLCAQIKRRALLRAEKHAGSENGALRPEFCRLTRLWRGLMAEK